METEHKITWIKADKEMVRRYLEYSLDTGYPLLIRQVEIEKPKMEILPIKYEHDNE